MVVPVMVYIYPHPTKLDEAWDLVQWVSSQVHQNEPKVSLYRFWKTEEGNIVGYLEIESKEALAQRKEFSHHKEVKRLTQEKDMLKEPLKWVVLGEESGWKR